MARPVSSSPLESSDRDREITFGLLIVSRFFGRHSAGIKNQTEKQQQPSASWKSSFVPSQLGMDEFRFLLFLPTRPKLNAAHKKYELPARCERPSSLKCRGREELIVKSAKHITKSSFDGAALLFFFPGAFSLSNSWESKSASKEIQLQCCRLYENDCSSISWLFFGWKGKLNTIYNYLWY